MEILIIVCLVLLILIEVSQLANNVVVDRRNKIVAEKTIRSLERENSRISGVNKYYDQALTKLMREKSDNGVLPSFVFIDGSFKLINGDQVKMLRDGMESE